MMNLIQLLTDQRAYKGITHSRWGASWNWCWRWVGDDEERRSPSPQPQTDSGFALPRKNRAWRRLRLVDRDNSFSLIFSGKIGFYSVGFRACEATRWGQLLGNAVISKNFLRTRKIMVMHINERGEYHLRTLIDRKRKLYDNAVDVVVRLHDRPM